MTVPNSALLQEIYLGTAITTLASKFPGGCYGLCRLISFTSFNQGHAMETLERTLIERQATQGGATRSNRGAAIPERIGHDASAAGPQSSGAPGAWAAVAWASAALAACGGGASPGEPTTPAQAFDVAQNMQFASAITSAPLEINAPAPSTPASANAAGVPQKQVLRQGIAPATATVLTADTFMTFVEGALPTMFTGPQTSVSASSGGITYVYRTYSLPGGAVNFLAVTSDNKVYGLGAFTAGVLTQYGSLADYNCVVYPQNCPAPGAGPANATEAARFLGQATLGATRAEIDALQSSTYSAWIEAQFALPQSQSHYDWLYAKGYVSDLNNANSYAGMDYSFWRKFIGGKDALRQRVTLALSEILVASAAGIAVSWRMFVVANYLDILENNAFGNYRTLLEQVSLSTAMGVYLTYRGNVKANAATGSQPDENYARELMQLFTVGLQLLNPDGSVQTSNGVALETYSQDDVSGLARVWTGWDFDTTGYVGGYLPEVVKRPMIQMANRYETGSKSFLGVTIPAGTTAANSLKIALDAVFNHPNTAPFVSKQLIQRLVTSNPSPAYVQRISSVFANNGAGVRGDLKAVIKAILIDSEARDMERVSMPSAGRLREPMVRFVNWARALRATSPTDVWAIGDLSDPASRLGQSPMRSGSVFNFFRPGYVPAGSDLSSQGLTAPEFQITNESSIPGYLNFMQRVISNGFGDVKADYSSLLALVGDTNALLAELNLVFAANQIPSTSITIIKTALDAMSVVSDTGKQNRIYTAVFLVMATPAYAAQK